MVVYLLPLSVSTPIYDNLLSPITDFLEFGLVRLIPSPMLGKLCWTINGQKCTTVFMCLFLMQLYGTWDNATSWTYLSMHGCYGILWCLKEVQFASREDAPPFLTLAAQMIMPDPQWQKRTTLVGHIVAIVGVLAPYW